MRRFLRDVAIAVPAVCVASIIVAALIQGPVIYDLARKR